MRKTLLLMGSSAYRDEFPPQEFTDIIDEATTRGDLMLVGEAHGASRAFQRYLHKINYRNVVVGHAKKVRYNIGKWETRKYGDTLPEREKAMVKACDYALIIWVDKSSVVANNVLHLKKFRKPTFIYEVSNKDGSNSFYSI